MNPQEQLFEDARKLYPGTKKGFKREYTNFILRSTKPVPNGLKFNLEDILPILKQAIAYQIKYRDWCTRTNKWTPQWKNFQTWINNGCWEESYGDFDENVNIPSPTFEEKQANAKARADLRKI